MLIFTAALLGLGMGSTFTFESGTKGRAAGLGLTALALLLVILSVVFQASSPASWPPSAWTSELGGWLIWTLIGLVGAATAVFSDDIRLSLQGVAIAATATALLLIFADSPAAALAIIASCAALLMLVVSAPRNADAQGGFNYPWLGAIGAGLLTFVLLTANSSDRPGGSAAKAKAVGKTSEAEASAATLADCLIPAVVVVAFAILHRAPRRTTSNREPDGISMEGVDDVIPEGRTDKR